MSTLYFARDLVLPILIAILLDFVLSPLVRALARVWIPEPVGAALVMLALLSGLGYGAYELAGPTADWLHRAPQSLQKVQSKLRGISKPVQQVQQAAEKVQDMATGPSDGTPEVTVKGPSLISQVLSRTQRIVASGVLVVVLVYFLLASGDLFLRKTVKVLPHLAEKKRAVEIAHRIEHDISRYLLTITLINSGLGAATATALFFLGMPNVVLWGVMVAVMNFLPYLGATINLIVLALAALLTFNNMTHAALVPVVFLALTTLEGQLITPLILGRSLTLNPVVIFISLIFLVWMWGIPGALLAVPVLAVIKIFCDSIEALAPIGEFLGR
jgi:predicted PurR-regulated permease PerM